MRNGLAVVLATLAVIAICVGGWFGYWALARQGQSNRYDVNTHSQQYQAGLIAQERDKVSGYDVATDAGQKEQIRQTFCAVYPQLNPPPSDLVSANARMC